MRMRCKIWRLRKNPIRPKLRHIFCWPRRIALSEKRRKHRQRLSSSASWKKAPVRRRRSEPNRFWKKKTGNNLEDLRIGADRADMNSPPRDSSGICMSQSWPGCLRRGVSSRQRGAAVEFGLGFFREALLAIDGSDHAVEVGFLRRKLDRFL